MSQLPRHLTDLSRAMDNALGTPIEEHNEILKTDIGDDKDTQTSMNQTDKRFRGYLKEVEKYARWSGEQGERNLEEAKDSLLEYYPDAEEEVRNAIARGREYRVIEKKAESHVLQGRDVPENLKNRIRNEFAHLVQNFDRTIEKASNRRSRGLQDNVRDKNGKAIVFAKPRHRKPAKSSYLGKPLVTRREAIDSLDGLHASDIRRLEPRSKWSVLIDETGWEYGPDAQHKPDRSKGKFVALIIPSDPIQLKESDLHATDCNKIEVINQAFQYVLDADVGVFGVSINCLPVTPNERWMDGVALLLDWVLRLLPVDSHTTIEALIEQRGRFTPDMKWDLVERQVMRRLGIAYPNRASKISISIKTITKEGSPYNGYVDAVAYTWGRTMKTSKARLEQSELVGNCLLEIDSAQFLGLWDNFAQGVALLPEKWWEILEEYQTTSLVANLLKAVGNEAKANTRLWERYLNETRRQMSLSPVNLRKLWLAVEWLQSHQPAETKIPPLLRLSWLTVALARSNHSGSVESDWEKELEQLAPTLIEEAAPYVCQAHLHLAVAHTNRFNFQAAAEVIKPWKEQPVAVPGLKAYNQVISSMGQHAAFKGDQGQSVEHFRRALAGFARLSDENQRQMDLMQTSAYLAIAQMDAPEADAEEVRAAVEVVVGPIESAVEKLATSSAPKDRYAHYLLLRWLVNRGDENVKNAYVKTRTDWKEGQGHPWPLIQLYRGMLLVEQNKEEALKLAIRGSDLALNAEQGATVRLIGACSRAIAYAWGGVWKDEDIQNCIELLRKDLPSAIDRIDFLSEWLSRPTEPEDLLRRVLPFNFR